MYPLLLVFITLFGALPLAISAASCALTTGTYSGDLPCPGIMNSITGVGQQITIRGPVTGAINVVAGDSISITFENVSYGCQAGPLLRLTKSCVSCKFLFTGSVLQISTTTAGLNCGVLSTYEGAPTLPTGTFTSLNLTIDVGTAAVTGRNFSCAFCLEGTFLQASFSIATATAFTVNGTSAIFMNTSLGIRCTSLKVVVRSNIFVSTSSMGNTTTTKTGFAAVVALGGTFNGTTTIALYARQLSTTFMSALFFRRCEFSGATSITLAAASTSLSILHAYVGLWLCACTVSTGTLRVVVGSPSTTVTITSASGWSFSFEDSQVVGTASVHLSFMCVAFVVDGGLPSTNLLPTTPFDSSANAVIDSTAILTSASVVLFQGCSFSHPIANVAITADGMTKALTNLSLCTVTLTGCSLVVVLNSTVPAMHDQSNIMITDALLSSITVSIAGCNFRLTNVSDASLLPSSRPTSNSMIRVASGVTITRTTWRLDGGSFSSLVYNSANISVVSFQCARMSASSLLLGSITVDASNQSLFFRRGVDVHVAIVNLSYGAFESVTISIASSRLTATSILLADGANISAENPSSPASASALAFSYSVLTCEKLLSSRLLEVLPSDGMKGSIRNTSVLVDNVRLTLTPRNKTVPSTQSLSAVEIGFASYVSFEWLSTTVACYNLTSGWRSLLTAPDLSQWQDVHAVLDTSTFKDFRTVFHNQSNLLGDPPSSPQLVSRNISIATHCVKWDEVRLPFASPARAASVLLNLSTDGTLVGGYTYGVAGRGGSVVFGGLINITSYNTYFIDGAVCRRFTFSSSMELTPTANATLSGSIAASATETPSRSSSRSKPSFTASASAVPSATATASSIQSLTSSVSTVWSATLSTSKTNSPPTLSRSRTHLATPSRATLSMSVTIDTSLTRDLSLSTSRSSSSEKTQTFTPPPTRTKTPTRTPPATRSPSVELSFSGNDTTRTGTITASFPPTTTPSCHNLSVSDTNSPSVSLSFSQSHNETSFSGTETPSATASNTGRTPSPTRTVRGITESESHVVSGTPTDSGPSMTISASFTAVPRSATETFSPTGYRDPWPCPGGAVNVTTLPSTVAEWFNVSGYPREFPCLNLGDHVDEGLVNIPMIPPLFVVFSLPPTHKLLPGVDYTTAVSLRMEVVGGRGQSQFGGFDGQWGAALRSAVWLAISPTSVAAVLPIAPFDVLLPERIFINLASVAIEHGCLGSSEGSFRVDNDPNSVVGTITAVTSGIVSNPVTSTAFGLGTTVSADAQALVLVGLMSCASGSEARQTTVLRFVLSVFYDYGFVAVVLGNLGIAVLVVLVQGVCVLVFRRGSRRKTDWMASAAAVWFPKVSYTISMFLFNGIALGGGTLVQNVASSPIDAVVGVIGICACVATIYLGRYMINNYVRVTFVVYAKALESRKLPSFFYPTGFWVPDRQRQVFGSFFSHMSERFYQHGNYMLFQTFITALISSVKPPKQHCYLQYIFLAFWFYAWMVALAYYQPLRCRFNVGVQVLSNFVLGTMMLLNVVNYLSPHPTIAGIGALLSLLQVLVIIVNLFHHTLTSFLEGWLWRKAESNAGGSNDHADPSPTAFTNLAALEGLMLQEPEEQERMPQQRHGRCVDDTFDVQREGPSLLREYCQEMLPCAEQVLPSRTKMKRENSSALNSSTSSSPDFLLLDLDSDDENEEEGKKKKRGTPRGGEVNEIEPLHRPSDNTTVSNQMQVLARTDVRDFANLLLETPLPAQRNFEKKESRWKGADEIEDLLGDENGIDIGMYNDKAQRERRLELARAFTGGGEAMESGPLSLALRPTQTSLARHAAAYPPNDDTSSSSSSSPSSSSTISL